MGSPGDVARSVLIIEDDDRIRRIVSITLRRRGLLGQVQRDRQLPGGLLAHRPQHLRARPTAPRTSPGLPLGPVGAGGPGGGERSHRPRPDRDLPGDLPIRGLHRAQRTGRPPHDRRVTQAVGESWPPGPTLPRSPRQRALVAGMELRSRAGPQRHASPRRRRARRLIPLTPGRDPTVTHVSAAGGKLSAYRCVIQLATRPRELLTTSLVPAHGRRPSSAKDTA